MLSLGKVSLPATDETEDRGGADVDLESVQGERHESGSGRGPQCPSGHLGGTAAGGTDRLGGALLHRFDRLVYPIALRADAGDTEGETNISNETFSQVF